MGIYHTNQLAFAGYPSESRALELQWGTRFPAWFQDIPPERVGLQGEYDYYGLQKRVEALLYQHFSPMALASLKVGQRGRVVTFQGAVDTPDTLKQMVDLAMTVNGTIRVETVSVVYSVPVHQ